MKPTIVLVHGAFAESSSWDRVVDPLLDAGHPVIAAANPLRGRGGRNHPWTPKSRRPKPFDAPAEALTTAYSRLSRNRELRV